MGKTRKTYRSKKSISFADNIETTKSMLVSFFLDHHHVLIFVLMDIVGESPVLAVVVEENFPGNISL